MEVMFMAIREIPAILKARRGTTEEWEEYNPVLLLGEIGAVTAGRYASRFKVGDGVKNWNQLDYNLKDGIDGLAGEVRIERTETLPPGQNASVQNIGTSNQANLIIRIPRGEIGHIVPNINDLLELNHALPTDFTYIYENSTQLLKKISIENLLTADILRAYPVDAIYMSVSATSPATLFGGTWTRWGNGRVPVGLGSGTFATIEGTGGSENVALTPAQTGIRTHTHPMPHTHNLPNHVHAIGGWVFDMFTHAAINSAAIAGVTSIGRVVTNDPIGSGMSALDYNSIGSASNVTRFRLTFNNRNSDNPTSIGTLQPSNTANTSGVATADQLNGANHTNMPPWITCYMWKRTA
jgi:hypothetical protein